MLGELSKKPTNNKLTQQIKLTTRMNQISQDVSDGTCCQLCNEYFKIPGTPPEKRKLYTHGHPVVCEECWEDLLSNEQEQYKKADVPTITATL